MLVGAERDLLAVVRRPDPRALHPDAPPAERDLTRFVAATDRDAVRVVLALRADDLVDLRLHQLLQHAQPGQPYSFDIREVRFDDGLSERLGAALVHKPRIS
jgi:hypothetical protein